MASTYTFIASQTLGVNTKSIVFNNIPQNYTDLVIKTNLYRNITGGNGDRTAFVQFNSDTQSNYSATSLYGNGSAGGSGKTGAVASLYMLTSSDVNAGRAVCELHLLNYSSTNTYKTALATQMSTGGNQTISSGLWKSYNPITSINIFENTDGFKVGDSVSIYGIKAVDTTFIVPTKAYGGDVIGTDGTYTYHAFKSTGAFIPATALTADVLVVAGGGGGGTNMAGGGGAGGLLAFTSQALASGTSYTCTVGSGGASSVGDNSIRGYNGVNSQFAALTASVGGGGGGSLTAAVKSGSTGGSGGGGAGGFDGGSGGSGGSFTSGQGSSGGTGATGSNGSYLSGAGGGGAGGNGSNGTGLTAGGAGGIGSNTYSSWLYATKLGFNGYIAGGGGGGGYASSASGGVGGTGGGGNGGGSSRGSSGTPNTGGGGGGGGNAVTSDHLIGYAGGSGVIIVRYAN